MAKILIHTLGSSGDFNPFMALALELRTRGHDIHWAVNPTFAKKAQGMGFAASIAGPDPDWQSELLRRMLTAHSTDPVRIMFEEVLIPAIVPAAEALEPLARESDLFLSHTIQLAASAVAERTGVPWISASAATMIYETQSYPPPGVAWKGCPAFLSRLGWQAGYHIFRGLDELAAVEYRKLGVSPRQTVVAGGAYSRRLTLGLWSPSFFPRPSDWPAWFQVGGYARWDGPPAPNDGREEPTRQEEPTPPPPNKTQAATLPQREGEEVFSKSPRPPVAGVPLRSDLSRSKEVGSSPLPRVGGPLILFTLGSSVVNYPDQFWQAALGAMARTDWNAILLGAPADLPVPAALGARVQIIPFVPYADIFPPVDAIVHQGGVGTTQAACYYGIPSLVVPRGFDQFENAAHVQREVWGLRLMPQDFSATALRLRLERLLRSEEIKKRVADLSRRMQAEPGVSRSADLVEAALPGS